MLRKKMACTASKMVLPHFYFMDGVHHFLFLSQTKHLYNVTMKKPPHHRYGKAAVYLLKA